MTAVMERTGELLSADELVDLTDYSQAGKQAAWLAEQKIPHRIDGRRVIVSRVHLRAWLEGHTAGVASSGPKFSAIK